MTEKRFIIEIIEDKDVFIHQDGANHYLGVNGYVNGGMVVDLLNALHDENEQLKQELKIYRKIANCSNCHHHDYDWFDDGDEFEVCEKGNDISDRICEDWRKF